MTDLSPAAQAVLDAFGKHPLHYDNPSHGLLYGALPAALRAAADQLLAVQWNGQIPADTAHQLGVNWARDALHVLATELEAQ